ncbi:hypothetical protein ACLI4Y_06325 [Natrialbaceae archaeon A-CW3]
MSTQTTDGGSDIEKWKLPTIAGIVAFLGGFLVTYVLKGSDVSGELAEEWNGGAEEVGEPSTFEAVSWLFFEAHQVSIEMSGSWGDESFTEPAEIQELAAWDGYLQLIPIIAIVAVAFVFVKNYTQTASAEEGAKQGAMIAAGYALAAVVIAYTGTFSESMTDDLVGTVSMSIGPDLVEAVLLAGLVYPAVGGALGGYFGHEQRPAAENPASANGVEQTYDEADDTATVASEEQADGVSSESAAQTDQTQ